MKIKVYTDDDVLAGEIEIPQGATFVSNHPGVTTAMIKSLMAARRHEAGIAIKGNGDTAIAPVRKHPQPPEVRYDLIRKDIVEGINRYVLLHQEVGHFLTAVLENNLKEAFGAADADNITMMFEIVCYCYNEIPKKCWGSPLEVKEWLTMKERPHVSAPQTAKEWKRQVEEGIWCGRGAGLVKTGGDQ